MPRIYIRVSGYITSITYIKKRGNNKKKDSVINSKFILGNTILCESLNNSIDFSTKIYNKHRNVFDMVRNAASYDREINEKERYINLDRLDEVYIEILFSSGARKNLRGSFLTISGISTNGENFEKKFEVKLDDNGIYFVSE